MRSFSLFALAAAALAPFVAARPLLDNSIEARAFAGLPAVPAVPGGLEVRGQKGCQEILIDLKVNVDVQVTELKYLTKANATVEVITPILSEVVEIVGGAVVELQALVGAELSVILVSVDGTVVVAVSVIVQLLAEILCLVLGALGFLLTIVADVSVLVSIVVKVALGGCLCGLIDIIVKLVGCTVADIAVILCGLLPNVVDIILTLGLSVVGSLLVIL